jgi:hypothetical protein
MKARSQERGKSHINKARDCYQCGIANRLILEHASDGGKGAPNNSTNHKGKRFTNMYGVPWPLFNDLSQEFEAWRTDRGHHFNCKHLCPFKLCLVACFHQLRTGGSLTQFCESHSIVGSVFREYCHIFLDWHWYIRDTHIKMPETKDEIDHVENIYCLIGYPGCLDSIDCVHIPWGACTWTLQTQ